MSYCKEVRRIRLDLSEVLKDKPRVWFLINPKPYVETVKLLKERLAEKFQFKNGLKFSLYLDEFEIPDDESVLIFRDDDLVVVKHVAEVVSSLECSAAVPEVAACSSTVVTTATKTKKRKRKSEDDEEINSKKVRRRRIDRQEEEVIRDQSCSPSPEREEAACSEAEEPSSEVEPTAVPKKKKHKKKNKKEKKSKKAESDAEEIEEDGSDHECEPQVVTPTVTEDEAEDSPKTPTPKKKRRRRKKRKAYKTSDEVTEEENPGEESVRTVTPLNMGQWRPAGSHLRFEDEDDGQDIANSQIPIQVNDGKDELLTLPKVMGQKVPVVIRRRKKTSPENPAIEKEHQVNEKEHSQESCSDYSKCSALQGPPRPGDIIAYKELELSAEYCPEVSNYKEGVVMNYDPDTKVVTVEFLPPIVRKVATGRFELRTPPPVDEYGDYMEEPEQEETETITEGSIALDCMIEPKLISAPCSQKSPAY